MFVKQCRTCKEDKPLGEFARHSLAADGLTPNCRACGGVDIKDYLQLRIETPVWTVGLYAAAIVNEDIGAVQYYIGKLEEANALYPIVLREIVKLLSAALDRIESERAEMEGK